MVHHESFEKYLANYNNKKAISNNTFKDKKVGENVKFPIRAILNIYYQESYMYGWASSLVSH